MCTDWSDPSDPDTYCSTWDDATGECTAWVFCTYDSGTNTDICSDWASLCTEYDTDGVTCIAFTDPTDTDWDDYTDSADDVCTSYDTDGTCLQWGYDLDDYCVTWNDVDATVCEVYNFCITQTDGTELCT